jgi:hypothetical protein
MAGYGSLPYLDLGLWGFISLGMEGGSTIYLLLFCYRFFFYIYFCMSLELIWMLFSLTLRLGEATEGVFFYPKSSNGYYSSEMSSFFSIYLSLFIFLSSLFALLGICGKLMSSFFTLLVLSFL